MGNARGYTSGNSTSEATKTSGRRTVESSLVLSTSRWQGNSGGGRPEGWGDSRIDTSRTALEILKARALERLTSH